MAGKGRKPRDHLSVVDSRTNKTYEIPVEDNFVRASDLAKIKAPVTDDPDREEVLGVFDRGFENVACMESSITKIDGHRGTITFRNIPIEKVFHENDFDDVMHLLVWGSLPSTKEKESMRDTLYRHSNPPDSVASVIQSFPRDADPFAMTIAGLSAFAAADEEVVASRHEPRPVYYNNLETVDKAVLRSVAYVMAVFALVYCHQQDKPFTPPREGQSLLGNMLIMMGFEVSDDRSTLAGKRLHGLQRLWILYADHEMTNSTAAALHVGSTLTDPVSCVMATIISGAGPLHVGAIEMAYNVLDRIGTPDNIPLYIDAVKEKKMRLFGYGHRVYKTRDPRVDLLYELLEEYKDLVSVNPLLRVALEIDKTANTDPYFVQRNLKVNVDLFGCFLYTAFGFKQDILVGLVAISRIPGVMAHWREAMGQSIKIWRPRQKYRSNL